jgi:2-polyprenyl-3-methyl-5-hydroxy-6-metoxy-1,4-benzoquinol methylase
MALRIWYSTASEISFFVSSRGLILFRQTETTLLHDGTLKMSAETGEQSREKEEEEESWDDLAEGWEEKEGVKEFAQQAYQSLISKLEISPSFRVLDFGLPPTLASPLHDTNIPPFSPIHSGCGTGTLTKILSPIVAEIVALDASDKMIQGLRQRHPLPNVVPVSGLLTEGRVQETACLQTKFDLIIASSVCGFLPDYPGTLQILRSLLTPQGIFVQVSSLSPVPSPTSL